ncbi:bifunctional [glutamine synthetase] adenylyltransferase/[glutamine synthetase]-adenylyl-L-tyrosine phosphorylase [Leucobacter sp. UT-8R-CII-1-4]|uniref:bifunctional [glutamine synthetase] adenylyltransferase/[glutamine synthetase]-adenylyl-L-tyrosine phosphorylase n=1 Tax=Leucobacter sp. UT-8R-CII-1-4 TaxID=3040075 RepID=UPI0024A9DBA9|nr:bifunctional [glutamine synthetase] adenylyltransferase/[glutamine synthetase]-adenylyl-L-tyrosine phosphorylase [Leucobacter sp. UT-8R-CII-1-4]MDI6024285.1 bifunctional [glutamine synthetase] adenylyltransferase/[glutamine synthetase]-adenylyl-L-tyrosine phosphorylase [Leucobacter sp. UT-8R-CII-1-4]
MPRKPEQHTLGEFARAGFQSLSDTRTAMLELSDRVQTPVSDLLLAFAWAGDPDSALQSVNELVERHPAILSGLDASAWQRVCLLFGASPALASFFSRRPETLRTLLASEGRLLGRAEARESMLQAVGAVGAAGAGAGSGGAGGTVGPFSKAEDGTTALRVRYRELLAEVVLFDLLSGTQSRAVDELEAVAASLSHLADAALEAGLAVARATLLAGESHGSAVSTEKLDAVQLAIIAMGKCGAEELNVVSDVDVMFVYGVSSDSELDPDVAVRIATQLATETMRAIHDHGAEAPLWQVDPNLRPEGRQGALVRSLGSMLAYYERWAKTWEFQALLKARPAAGDTQLGAEFVAETREMVWSSSGREDFVGSVQRMRERVTEHIDPDELEVQLKLGPGGLRDIEFSVQLLQLVHGQYNESLRRAGTLPALRALVHGGFVAREDGERLAHDYRVLRLLEHRLQLRDLRRTALMPRDEDQLRVLARASRLATNSKELLTLWREIRTEVRDLHLKIFYAPLLNAVAALPGDEFSLGSDEAKARLHGIGFRDPEGAMRHLAALTKGSSRSARIQRNLLPVLLQWLADGRDPDYGLLAFRKVSEANADNTWYLRLLRDGNEAAERLTRVLSSSRFAADLLETIPSAVAWLERDEKLRPVGLESLLEEMRSLASRRESAESAAEALRAVHRREVLRLALGRLVFVNDDADVARGLDAAHTALLDGLLLALRARGVKAQPEAELAAEFELALIAMGRYGGGEMGFSSDIDLLAVYRAPAGANESEASAARKQAERLVAELRRLVSDPRFSVDLDFDLRPEGKNGPIVRSLDAYRAYYERWSLTWEAQALLRARPVAGDAALGRDFIALADRTRYPETFSENDTREVRRIKARVEAERLPQGTEPKRHLKLGPGGISDVEWLVQLLQLQHAAEHPALRTASTLAALDAAVDAEYLSDEDRLKLRDAWVLASRIRSAIKLWSDRSGDALPHDRTELEGIAGILGMPEARTTELEEQWLAASRRSREVVEREFFGFRPDELFM